MSPLHGLFMTLSWMRAAAVRDVQQEARSSRQSALSNQSGTLFHRQGMARGRGKAHLWGWALVDHHELVADLAAAQLAVVVFNFAAVVEIPERGVLPLAVALLAARLKFVAVDANVLAGLRIRAVGNSAVTVVSLSVIAAVVVAVVIAVMIAVTVASVVSAVVAAVVRSVIRSVVRTLAVNALVVAVAGALEAAVQVLDLAVAVVVVAQLRGLPVAVGVHAVGIQGIALNADVPARLPI